VVEGFDINQLAEAVSSHKTVVRVVITDFQGSAPRETGAVMLVWSDSQSGTIGGGALEWQVAKAARDMLALPGQWRRQEVDFPLGPALGQCCGGTVALLLERFQNAEILEIDGTAPRFTRPKQDGISPTPAPLQTARLAQRLRSGAGSSALGWFSEAVTQSPQPLWLYGAGHVGREIIRVFQGLPFDLTWIDTARSRFPPDIPKAVAWHANVNPAALVSHAPDDALHFVLTYSHAHDFEICHHVLSRSFAHLGLIGSASKKARFLKRLRELEHSEPTLKRLQCPIGDRSLGKTPQAIAIGLAYSLMHSNITKQKETKGRVSA